ncbi:hypothetical protein EB796_004008 [Bugula neritina]|uniref:Fucosyltransferase n=1 Tax=Bugula neritina TaxID=10212 RepID=A0A7J7KGH3_BUGNE|nr:hypothetical protein EB796_004008 [Bugula neritina]
MRRWNGYFNYTVVLKQDSDWRYMWAYDIELRSSDHIIKWQGVSQVVKALWFVSNCDEKGEYKVTSGRVEYAVELAKYIQLSIYTYRTLCENYISRYAPKLVVNLPDEKQPPLSDFHFYLAFENSLCEDYITEKFWKILEGRHLVIPIVMGGLRMEEYENIAPPNSYIHVKNFSSPKHLAEHLRYVVSNEKAFNYYLEWRNKYRLYKNCNQQLPRLYYSVVTLSISVKKQ